jgi:hypothetical protein
LGSEIGAHSDWTDGILDKIAADPDMPTDDGEKEQAHERAKDQFLAVMFLVNSNRARYGSLVRDIENKYTRGSDTYPATLSAAYDYLVNYRVDKTSNTHDLDEAAYPTTLKMTQDVVKAVAAVALGVEPVVAGAIVEAVGVGAAMKLVTAVGVDAVARHPGRMLKDKDVCTTRSVVQRVMTMPLI